MAAAALDLGPMRVESSFNEALRAYIPINDAAFVGGGGLRVTFYDPRSPAREIRAADILALSRLSHGIVVDDGQYYIELTTTQPVREARIDFILQVADGRGNAVRRRYLRALPGSYVAGGAGGRNFDRSLGNLERNEGRQFGLGRSAPGDVVDSSDYPNLWTMALETRAGYGVSVYQTQLAIMEANPKAFGRDGEQIANVNYLLSGHEVTVPSLRGIREYDRASSVVRVAEMNYASGHGPVHERALRSIIRLEPVARPVAPVAPVAVRPQPAPAWAERPTAPTAPPVAAPLPSVPAPEVAVGDAAAIQIPSAQPLAPPTVVAPPPEPVETPIIGYVVGAVAVLVLGFLALMLLRRRSDEQVVLAEGGSALSEQLDLAQSYIEMRDWDRARELVDGVIASQDATDEDKEAARDLQRQIPS